MLSTKDFIKSINLNKLTISYTASDGLAKHQKKTSCISTSETGHTGTIRQLTCSTSFLGRGHEVIASFSFGTLAVQTRFGKLLKLEIIY